MRVPTIPMAIPQWLMDTHPERVIGVHETEAQAQRRAGFQDCIELLLHTATLQSRTDLSEDEKELLAEMEEAEDPE